MPDIFINQTDNNKDITGSPVASAPQQRPATTSGLLNNLLSGHTHPIHLFTSYAEMPTGITFDTQESDEIILLFLRRAFITNIPWITATILLIGAPFLIGYVVVLSNSPFQYFPPNFLLILRVFYYLIVASYIYVNFITWYFNISLITDKRVVDVDFEDLIYKNVAGTKLNLVQDVSFSQVGAMRTIFNFGDVLIQTAGSIDNFELKAIPQSERTVQIVETLLGKETPHVS